MGRRLVHGFVRSAVSHPGYWTLAWCLLLGFGGAGVVSVRVDTTTESILHRDAPEWAFYQESLEKFGNDEVVVLAFAGDEPFSPDVVRSVVNVSGELDRMPGVRRIDSISTLPIVWPASDGRVSLDPAFTHTEQDDEAAITEAIVKVSHDRLANRMIVSDDGQVLAINVLPAHDFGGDYERFVKEVEARSNGRHQWISGVPIFRAESNSRTRKEIVVFVPLTVIAIAALMRLAFGSWRAPLISLAVSGSGSLLMLGSMGFLSVPITFSTMILPSIIIALGSAYTMHVLSAARGTGSRSHLLRSITPVAIPVVLSGITTAIGFLAAIFVDIEAIQAIGFFGSIGVLFVLAGTLTLAPALLAFFPLAFEAGRLDRWLGSTLKPAVMRLAFERRGLALVCWSSVVAVSALGLGAVRVETDATRWFPKGSSVRDSYDRIRFHLSGISPMNVVIESRDGEPMTSPAALELLREFGTYINGVPDVGKAFSLADVLQQTHRAFSGEKNALPGSAALAEQYLLLLESVDHIGDLVANDRLASNVVLRIDNNGSARLREIASLAERWWESNAASFDAQVTGIMFEFARAEDEIAFGQLRSLSFALIAIALVLFLVLRDGLLASASLIPNAVPLTIAFGAMGYFSIPLDASTVILGSLALGIAVDDTIHLAAGYQRALARSREPRVALSEVLDQVLPALFFTTLVIAVGFAVLGASTFSLTRNLGLVTSLLVALCLIADLTLLAPLLVAKKGKRNRVTEGVS